MGEYGPMGEYGLMGEVSNRPSPYVRPPVGDPSRVSNRGSQTGQTRTSGLMGEDTCRLAQARRVRCRLASGGSESPAGSGPPAREGRALHTIRRCDFRAVSRPI